VDKVASNRRVLGPDGLVAFTRTSACNHPEASTAPEGVVDPLLRIVSLWNGEKPLASLSYYATHPMSYYGKGCVNWDFVGEARALMDQAVPGVSFIHFNGAGGNVTAGKYNDGNPENRAVLAKRVFAGMKTAWDSQKKQPVTAADFDWRVKSISLPPIDPGAEAAMLARVADPNLPEKQRVKAARHVVFMRRMASGDTISLACLRILNAHILHMPAELFVEYQLAAQQMRPDDFVALAAYGDNGPGYIGTEISYSQSGYEARVARVGPAAEKVMLKAIEDLLKPRSYPNTPT
jgi:hypothetical protein